MNDAENAGQLMNILLNHKGVIQALGRKVVINDVKLYAQANVNVRIDAFVTADSEGRKMYNAVHAHNLYISAILIFIRLILKPLEFYYELVFVSLLPLGLGAEPNHMATMKHLLQF